jgi:hypothetical protein
MTECERSDDPAPPKPGHLKIVHGCGDLIRARDRVILDGVLDWHSRFKSTLGV